MNTNVVSAWRRKVALDAWKRNDYAFWHPWWEALKPEKIEMDYSHMNHGIKNLHSFPVPKRYTHNLLEKIYD